MPMYWDARTVETKISRVKVELLADFFYTIVSQQNYFARSGGVLTLDEQMVDKDMAVIWAHMKRFIDPMEKHIEAYHAEGGLIEHAFDPEYDREPEAPKPGSILAERGERSASHGHIVPPVFILAENIAKLEDTSVTREEYEAARDELLSFVGFQVYASHSRVDPEEVFGAVS